MFLIGDPGPWQEYAKKYPNRSKEQIKSQYLAEQLMYFQAQDNMINALMAQGGSKANNISTDTTALQALRLLFSDIAAVDAIVGDSSNVSDWNTYFDLPTYGSPFTSVSVTGNQVKLYDGSNIIIKEMLFDQADELGTYLLEVDDTAGCIIEVEYDAFGYDNNSGCLNLTTANLPNCLTAGDRCFQGCGLLINLNLPNLTNIGNDSFNYCTSLVNLYLPELLTIENDGFSNCTALTTVNFPKATSFGNSCFVDCSNLTTVNLPELIYSGNLSFYGCTSLSNVTMPKLITAGTNFFNRCESLVNISLPELTSIGLQGLLLCTSLTTINIPLCTNLGGTVGNNLVFTGITGNTITLTVSSALMTCNSGNPDGDIQYLQANNAVTVVTV